MIIKKFEPQYADDVRNVCINTGPESAKTDPAVHNYILNTFCNYYIEQEPDNAFVLVDESNTAQGYVLCAADFKLYVKNFKPYLKEIGKTDKKLRINAIAEILGHSFFSLKYPAHLHIDINSDFTGGGNGTKLISALTESLKAKGVKGLMLIVGNQNVRAVNFYYKNGFEKIFSAFGGTVMAKEL